MCQNWATFQLFANNFFCALAFCFFRILTGKSRGVCQNGATFQVFANCGEAGVCKLALGDLKNTILQICNCCQVLTILVSTWKSLWRHLLYHLFFRSAHTLCADLETKKAFVATLKIFESFCRNSENISKHWNVFVATLKICREKWSRTNNEGLRILFCKKVQSGNVRCYNLICNCLVFVYAIF